MSIEFSFAAYLQSVGSTTMDDAISPSSSTVSSSESSPTKRARSYSPDTSISSGSPPESYFGKHGIDRRDSSANSMSGLTFSLGHNTTVSGIPTSSSGAPTTTSNVATPCPLRSILCSTLSMHGPSASSTTGSSDASFLSSPATTSPPMSRPLSRRSSHSTKSVRFARCTNASVFPALSGEEYDRSPIIPTQESESLELPKRHKSEEEGWIKCVERERAAAAKKGVKPDLSNCGPCAQSQQQQQLSTKSSLESPVEGVRGLISGGYFVGEERDRSSPVLEDMAPTLGLALEQSHHEHDHDGHEEDDDDVLAATGGVDDMVVDDEETGVDHVQDDSSGDDSDVGPSSSTDEASSAVVDGESATSDASASSASNKCREAVKQRYGLCALGKWSRRELFTSHDSLGGF